MSTDKLKAAIKLADHLLRNYAETVRDENRANEYFVAAQILEKHLTAQLSDSETPVQQSGDALRKEAILKQACLHVVGDGPTYEFTEDTLLQFVAALTQSPTGTVAEEVTLGIILDHHVEGKRLVVRGLEVEVQCVDGCYYKKKFKTEEEADSARSLSAIFPSVWVKQ